MVDVSSIDNVIDSRDVIQRIEELEDERDGYVSAIEVAKQDASVLTGKNQEEEIEEAGNAIDKAEDDLRDWDNDNGDELKSLKSLADEGSNCSGDWIHGESLINDEYWVQYVQELLEDIGDLPKDLPHYIVIDWEKTAENIQVDYSSVDFDGTTFWIRSC
jgi:hypothetical protein